MRWRLFCSSLAALLLMTGFALAQPIGPHAAVSTAVPSMPVFTPPSSSAPPPPTVEHSIDANGEARDTITTYRSGPFGTYTDHSAITTYPPGNPSLGVTNPH